MADGFVCRGLLSTTIQTLFKEAIKCVHLGNDCYPGFLRILISVDAFITNTFLLLYVHFSNDAVFLDFHLGFRTNLAPLADAKFI